MGDVYVDDMMLATLISMGFDESISRQALAVSGNSSVDTALELILSGSLADMADVPQHYEEPPKPAQGLRGNTPKAAAAPPPEPLAFDPCEITTDYDDYEQNSQPDKGKLRQSTEGTEGEDYEDLDFSDGAALGIPEREATKTKCFDERKLAEAAANEIRKIMSLTGFGFSDSAALLKHYKWDAEKLTERYFEDPEKVAAAVGVVLDEHSDDPIEGDCLICGDEMTAEDASISRCGHAFCNICWQGYLEVKIKEGEALGIPCMMHKCGKVVDSNLVKRVVSPEAYKKYTHFITKGFVDQNPNMQWCPAPGCTNAVLCELSTELRVPCNCGYRFCFVCHGEAHAPAKCDDMKKWDQKCKDDSETANWLNANTKDCPKCHTAIEKNGGCNHMTCRSVSCKHEFCWICMGNWIGHTACNRYKEGEAQEEDASTARKTLERYLHYYHRFKAHMDSQKFENELRQKAVEKMMDLRARAETERSANVDYIFNATEQLIECRRTLKHTYVLAFYLPDLSPEKNLFEWLQEELEVTTESLSGVLEKPISGSAEEKRKIIDLTNLARTRLEHLLDGVREGLTQGARFTPEGREIRSSSEGLTSAGASSSSSLASFFTGGSKKAAAAPKKGAKKRGGGFFGRG